MKVAFIHPDLGIGGAERLVVDAALSMQSNGHTVQIYTSHHDDNHCFQETRNGLLSVITLGDWLPRSVFGQCLALCAYIRMVYVALCLVLYTGFAPDVIFCDQVSACVPVLKAASSAKVMFYCHFPDMLLSHRGGMFKSAYRFVLDWIEEATTGMSDLILVNTKVFRETFKSLADTRIQVLYPALNTRLFDEKAPPVSDGVVPPASKYVFLSINRFERKKNLELAILAFDHFRTIVHKDIWSKCHLVIAGGYDVRVLENVDYFAELNRLVHQLDLHHKISFVQSFSFEQKLAMLRRSYCLLYTPSNEHFGIVPLEAMYTRRPVVACASGGPLETIRDEKSGFHCDEIPSSWATRMALLVNDEHLAVTMGAEGRARVETHYDFQSFTKTLNNILISLVM